MNKGEKLEDWTREEDLTKTSKSESSTPHSHSLLEAARSQHIHSYKWTREENWRKTSKNESSTALATFPFTPPWRQLGARQNMLHAQN